MSDSHEEVYAEKAQVEAYERLVAREDWEGRLLPAIQQIAPLPTARVVESGAGTGRLTRLLTPHVASIQAFDRSQSMLVHAEELSKAQLAASPCDVELSFVQASHDALPVEDGVADLVIAGWSVCYCISWGGDGWEERVDTAVRELLRACKSDGVCVLIETLGTGVDVPTPPETLVPYYERLESLWGFQREWIRTDYRFADRAEGDELVRFFFGDERADRALAAHDAAGLGEKDPMIVPECTGIWSRRAS